MSKLGYSLKLKCDYELKMKTKGSKVTCLFSGMGLRQANKGGWSWGEVRARGKDLEVFGIYIIFKNMGLSKILRESV